MPAKATVGHRSEFGLQGRFGTTDRRGRRQRGKPMRDATGISSPSTITSPRLMPMRNWIQRGGGTSALQRAMRCWISTAHCSVAFTLGELDRNAVADNLIIRRVLLAIAGTISSPRRNATRWSRSQAEMAVDHDHIGPANIGRSVTAGSLAYGTAAASRAKAAANCGRGMAPWARLELKFCPHGPGDQLHVIVRSAWRPARRRRRSSTAPGSGCRPRRSCP